MSSAERVQQHDLDAYWTAVSSADSAAARAGVLEARERGVALDDLLQGLVVASQLRVGELWAGNEWSVAREHAATAVSEDVVRHLSAELAASASGPLLTVACVEREWHSLPTLVVATTLQARGFRVDHLGASTTRDRLVSRILDTSPRAVLLSASLTSSLPRARRHIEAVRGTGTAVVVGGRAFDREGVRAQRLGATAYAGSADDAVALLGALPLHVDEAPPLRHPGAQEARELGASTDTIARDVMRVVDTALGLSGGGEDALRPDDWRVVLATFVPHLVDSLVGALLCDDPLVMDEAWRWLDEVLQRRGASERAALSVRTALANRVADYPAAVQMLS